MAIFSRSKSSIKDVWVSTLILYRKVFNQVWYLAITLGAVIISALWVNIYFSKNGLPSKAIALVFPIVLTFSIIYLTSLVLYVSYQICSDSKVSLKEAVNFVNKKYIRLAGSMIIVFLLYSLGLLALLLPGVFVFIMFTMVQPLILIDENNIWEALKGSCKLVWGNWWRSFAIIFPLLFLNYLIVYSVGRAISDSNWLVIISNVLAAVLYYPLFYTCVLVLFNDLKLRKNDEIAFIVT